MSELEEKLNETVKALDHKIAKNIADLDSLKTSSKEYVNELRGYEEKKYQFYPQQYVAKSFLHLMHSSDDDGLRPNPVQSYKSAAIQLFDDKDTEVSKVKPETRYTCRCIVSNRGDLAAPIANVEYFINKEKEEDKMLLEINVVRRHPLHTEVIVRSIKGMAKVGDFVMVRSAEQFIYTKVIRVQRNLIQPFYSIDLQLFGAAAQLIKIKDSITEDPTAKFDLQQAFRFETEDIFTITGRGTVAVGTVLAGTFSLGNSLTLVRTGATLNVTGLEAFRSLNSVGNLSPGMNVGLLIRGSSEKLVRGDVLVANSSTNFNAIVEDIQVPTRVQDYDFLGVETLNVPALSAEVSEFELTTPKRDNRHHFVIAARAFASMPIDMPESFDELSPSLERHSAIKVFLWE